MVIIILSDFLVLFLLYCPFYFIELTLIIKKARSIDIEEHEQYLQRVDLLENELEKYPHSLRLMLELADSYSKGSEYPEYREKYYLQRTIDIEEYVAAHTTEPKLKYQTTAMLCYMYRELGKYNRIRELAETMPELYQTKPALIHHSMPGKQQMEGIYDYCKELIDAAEECLNMLIYSEMNDELQSILNKLRVIAANREMWNTAKW